MCAIDDNKINDNIIISAIVVLGLKSGRQDLILLNSGAMSIFTLMPLYWSFNSSIHTLNLAFIDELSTASFRK